MTSTLPVVDAEVMRRCWDVVNAMFDDQGIHRDHSSAWWRTPNGKLEDAMLGYRTPLDALLDGSPTDVYREAEAYCEMMRPLQKAGRR